MQGGDTLYQKNQRKDEEHWTLVFHLSDGSHLFVPYTQLKADAFGKYTEDLEEVWPLDLVKEEYDLFLHQGIASIGSIWWWKMTPWGLIWL